MRDPSFINYMKNGEERTAFAQSFKQLNEMLDECIELGYEITKVHVTENPKNFK